ncbi:MAG: hypothetical protein JSW41_02120 [Candidatus Aenigmatarchaeota archaeon]|nr:MAG: hypothetical protein JSW41_02120 [Candidatus Aenigmarchaeota archaeon]
MDLMSPSPLKKPEEKKKGEKSTGYLSEFNMSQLSMFRLDIMQKEADRYSIMCGNLEFRNLIPYVNTLKAIYRYVRTLMNKNQQSEYDNKFEEFRKILYSGKKTHIWNTYVEIEQLHTKIIQLMFERGLMWSVSKDKKYAEHYMKPEYRDM